MVVDPSSGPLSGQVRQLKRRPNTTWVPEGTAGVVVLRVWQAEVSGYGVFYCQARIDSDGRRTYLMRRESGEKNNDSAVLRMEGDGSVSQWYSDWEMVSRVSPGFAAAVSAAAAAAVVHSVMES